MARKLETTELVAIAVNVAVPGSGHLIQKEGASGVLFLLAAIAGGACFTPIAWVLIGVVAAVHLYTVLTKREDQKQLPTVDFKSLPKKDADAEDKPKPKEEAKPKQDKAKPEPAEKEEPQPEAKEEPKPEPEAKEEPQPEPEPEAKEEPEPEAKEEPQPEPEPEAEEEPQPEKKEEFTRPDTKSRIPSFKLSIPKPGEVSEAEADWPELIPYLTKKLKAVQDAMTSTEEFLAAKGKTWKAGKASVPDTAPTLLREVATELGAVEFDSMWSHGWPFGAGQTVSLFGQLEKDGKGWRFAHDKNDPSALAIIWMPTGEVVRRKGTSVETIADDLGAFIEDLAAGFRVAQASTATQAVLEADHLIVLPADEIEQGDESASFPDFWLGASGPGVKNVGWSFEAPYIRNPAGSRLADQKDAAMIEVFHEWLTTDAESPEGALEVARLDVNDVRPVGKVLLDGEVKVAWWGESPPEEVDMLINHLRDIAYAQK